MLSFFIWKNDKKMRGYPGLFCRMGGRKVKTAILGKWKNKKGGKKLYKKGIFIENCTVFDAFESVFAKMASILNFHFH